jgi:hypothetical protein
MSLIRRPEVLVLAVILSPIDHPPLHKNQKSESRQGRDVYSLWVEDQFKLRQERHILHTAPDGAWMNTPTSML